MPEPRRIRTLCPRCKRPWRYYTQHQKDFVLKDNLLFLNLTPSNSMETISVFVVPAWKHQAAIDGCHRSAGHQGRDQMCNNTKGTGASPDSERSPTTVSQGMYRREAYCLLVWVARNVDSVSTLDTKVPDYVWTEVIARDICTYRIGAPSGTFVVEL